MPSLRVPRSWLREYVDPGVGVDELAQRLHLSGSEVDHVERSGADWGELIRVARVSALERHPNADKLWLATVEYGEGRTRTVVTGATNLKVGDVVPYAEAGASLIDGHTGERFTLRPKPMRGIPSDGMVCSAKELGLGDDHEGILHLDPTLEVGATLRDVMGEAIIALEIAPNRVDALSIVGVAREVSALLSAPLHEPPADRLDWRLDENRLTVGIEDPTGCPRFCAAYLDGIRVGPSPAWLRERLVAAGMRPISNVVDVTNYVMLELGQPLHAYDATRLRGHTLVARRARPGEHLVTLDGIDRVLRPADLVIADEERALGLAGIIGGEDSEIRDDTTVVALEAASFEPRGIRRSSDAHGLQGSSGSAAARRFGLSLSPNLPPIALARAVRLLRELAGARVVGATDVYPAPHAAANVRLRFSDVARVVGMEVTREETLDVLRRLGFTTADDGDTLVVTPPALRTDIGIAEDVVEEVARVVGYDRIPTRIPSGTLPLPETHPLETFRELVRDLLAGFGLQETVSYSAIDPAWLGRLTADGSPIAPEPLRISNPTTVAQSVMRPTLRASLFDTASRNLRHRDGVAVFEIAPVYLPRPDDLPEERWMLIVLLAGRLEVSRSGETWLSEKRPWDIHDVRGIAQATARALRLANAPTVGGQAPGLHPGRSLTFKRDGRTVVALGQIDPRVAALWELPAETFVIESDMLDLLARVKPVEALAPPRYPTAWRELSIVVDEAVPYGDVEREIANATKGMIDSVTLVDLYRGPQIASGKKSLSVRLGFRLDTRTLADADVEKAMKRIEGRLLHQLGATLRG